MALFLVQHGKNLKKDVDPEQPLSDEGIAEVKRIAQTAANYNVQVGEIRHSGKKRALQTAEIFADHLSVAGGVHEMTGIKALDDVVPVAEAMESSRNIMLVGHLPFMERLTSYLTAGSQETTVMKFQNGGIVCLDQMDDSGDWAIKWTLMPNIG
ncbi:MAG: phosphohistidine phosphatase SixA [Desulfobacterales bacterium]|nr:phosphohistidine phosphatase SixA [Desulfobacterales bacterium]